jgi:hypothetical protein
VSVWWSIRLKTCWSYFLGLLSWVVLYLPCFLPWIHLLVPAVDPCVRYLSLGTLTENRMTVSHVWVDRRVRSNDFLKREARFRGGDSFSELVVAGGLCNMCWMKEDPRVRSLTARLARQLLIMQVRPIGQMTRCCIQTMPDSNITLAIVGALTNIPALPQSCTVAATAVLTDLG